MITRLAQVILGSPARLGFPVGAAAGLGLTGGTVRDLVSDARLQAEAVLALHERFRSPVVFTAMNLSAEAAAFGCEVRVSESEIPTVVGRKVAGPADLRRLPSAKPGDGPTAVPIETARLVRKAVAVPVLACMIGPFSLAARIFGVSEALEATALDPGILQALLERVTGFLVDQALAFRAAGASAVFVAEPAAGLLSPDSLARFSSPFVKRIVSGAQTRDFAVALHNCGARIVHLDRILEAGAGIYHFGAPMDIGAALERVAGQVTLGGNLDPAAIFCGGTPESVRTETLALCDATREFKNFFVSSGCDLPPGTPLANVEAFYRAVHDFAERGRTTLLPQ